MAGLYEYLGNVFIEDDAIKPVDPFGERQYEIFDAIDMNQDGVISKPEFMNMVEGGYSAPQQQQYRGPPRAQPQADVSMMGPKVGNYLSGEAEFHAAPPYDDQYKPPKLAPGNYQMMFFGNEEHAHILPSQPVHQAAFNAPMPVPAHPMMNMNRSQQQIPMNMSQQQIPVPMAAPAQGPYQLNSFTMMQPAPHPVPVQNVPPAQVLATPVLSGTTGTVSQQGSMTVAQYQPRTHQDSFHSAMIRQLSASTHQPAGVTSQPVSTPLTAPAPAGSTQLQIASMTGFAVGDDVQITDAYNSEVSRIQGFPRRTSSNWNIILQSPTKNFYGIGTTVVKVQAVQTQQDGTVSLQSFVEMYPPEQREQAMAAAKSVMFERQSSGSFQAGPPATMTLAPPSTMPASAPGVVPATMQAPPNQTSFRTFVTPGQGMTPRLPAPPPQYASMVPTTAPFMPPASFHSQPVAVPSSMPPPAVSSSIAPVQQSTLTPNPFATASMQPPGTVQTIIPASMQPPGTVQTIIPAANPFDTAAVQPNPIHSPEAQVLRTWQR